MRTVFCSGSRVYSDRRKTNEFPIVLACSPKNPASKRADCDVTLAVDEFSHVQNIVKSKPIGCTIDGVISFYAPRIPKDEEIKTLSKLWDLTGEDFWVLILDPIGAD